MKKIISLLVFSFPVIFSFANIQLPSVISSNMVLQQQSTVKLWGWAEPAEKIVVTVSWSNKKDSVITTRDATWQLSIQTPAAGGPFIITLKGYNTITLDNILVGEVWVCSGQSNMEMSANWGLPDVKEALPGCANNNIRLFHIAKATAKYPQDDCKGEWELCDSNSVKKFSAVGYFFGRKLNKDMNLPIGLVEAAWSGSSAEVWTPAELVNNDNELKASAAKQKPANGWPYIPGSAYNAMIAPVINYPIAGTIWYQGEGNTAAPATYNKLFTTMIQSWRNAWDKPFPFYYVQIAPFKYGNNMVGVAIREQQTKTMSFPNTGMVVVSDITGDTADIHPKNKHDVGLRLANWALAETYHKKIAGYKNPMYKSMEIQKDKVIITFDNAPTGLISKNEKVRTVVVAGADKVFYPAEVKIDNNKIILSSPQVTQPVAVRYQFTNTAIGNLFSKEGLPVAPFRTDDWGLE